MKRLNLIVLMFFFLSCNAIAQTNENIILHSLEFLNKNFRLNLEKRNEPVLVFFDSKYYVCNKYCKGAVLDLKYFKIRFVIDKVSEIKYTFSLKSSSEFTGTFEVIEEDDKYQFSNLKYMMRSK